ncbi:MAG: hypothetical protein U9N54_07735 [candidate division Zixibacteria bacterium]|nr:hypothetical protein [candidate division Zixibacteria bacterium]
MSSEVFVKVKNKRRMLRIDGDIENEIFKLKENEYKSQLIDIESNLKQSQKINLNYYEDGCKILELSNRLFSNYLKSDPEDKARILKLIASNFVLNGLSVNATYVKPFSFMENLGGRIIKRGLRDEFINWVIENAA